MIEVETSIKGIPCVARMTYYQPGTSGFIHSASLEPNDPEEIEFEILTSKGVPAGDWLTEKMTRDDEARIADELLLARRANE